MWLEAISAIFLISLTLGTLFVVLDNLFRKRSKREKKRTLHNLVKQIEKDSKRSDTIELPPPIEEELKRRRKSAK